MSLTVNRALLRPSRILIHGPQAAGKSWFAQRLATWLHLVQEVDPVVIHDDNDHAPSTPNPQCTIVIMSGAPERSKMRTHRLQYDWIFDMGKRPERERRHDEPDVTTVCSRCHGAGHVIKKIKTRGGKNKYFALPCHGRDCITKNYLVDQVHGATPSRIETATTASDPKTGNVTMSLSDQKLISAIVGQPAPFTSVDQPAAAKLPSVLEKMKQRATEADVGRDQLNAVRKVIKHDFSQEPHIPSVLAADVGYHIERLSGDLDLMMTALDTGASLNACARDEIRSSIRFDLSRLRSHFGGLKALILQDGEIHRIHHSGPAPF